MNEDRHSEILHELVRGDQEIAAGVGHELDDVLADADVLLGAQLPQPLEDGLGTPSAEELR